MKATGLTERIATNILLFRTYTAKVTMGILC